MHLLTICIVDEILRNYYKTIQSYSENGDNNNYDKKKKKRRETFVFVERCDQILGII